MFFIDDEPGSKPPTGIMGEWLSKFMPASRRQPKEWHGPRFEGRPMDINSQLDAVARRDARIVEANAPSAPVAGMIAKAVEAVVDAVAPVPPTELARAMSWLAAVLRNGPVAERNIRQMAASEKIAPRTLKRAKKRAGVRSMMNADRTWSWCLSAL